MPALLALAVLVLVAVAGPQRLGPTAAIAANRRRPTPDAYAAAAARRVFATISTQNATSPPFACVAAARLQFAPLGAAGGAALRHLSGARCQVTGASTAGEYVVAGGGGGPQTVIKALDLVRPVANLGGQQIFSDSWRSPSLADADAVAAAWVLEGGASCSAAAAEAGGGRLQLGAGCAVVGVPHEARTFSFFRHPLVVEVAGVQAGPGAAVRVGLEVPAPAAMAATGWPHVRHILPLFPVNATDQDASGGAASIAAELSAGRVQLLRRRLQKGTEEVLNASSIPAGCGTAPEPASVQLFAGSRCTVGRCRQHLATGVIVRCAGRVVANLTGPLGVDFHDRGGFGESAGEAVLSLRALAATGTPATPSLVSSALVVSNITVRNVLNPSSSPAVLGPISDQGGTVNWDHGELGAFHAVAGPPFGPDEGVLDATMPPFLADSTGRADATLSLQAAIDFARHNYLSIYLPAGQYLVSDSLNLTQHPRMVSGGFAQFNGSSNYCWSRFSTFAVRGESARSDASLGLSESLQPRQGRATLLVKPNTAAFALRLGNGTAPLAVLNVSLINSKGFLQPNILMSAVIQSIDIVIGKGNPAAVGVRMRGAQVRIILTARHLTRRGPPAARGSAA
jgi:hypothetical protein